MQLCKKCGSVMIKPRAYDPDGMIPLTIEEDEGEQWACINPACGSKDKKKKTKK